MKASPGKPDVPTVPKITWLTPYYDVWKAKLGIPPVGEMAKFLKPLDAEYGVEAVRQALTNYLNDADKYVSIARFAQTFKLWRPTRKPHSQTVDEADRKAGILP